MALDIFFSLVIPPDPALKEYVETRGFIALGEGRVGGSRFPAAPRS